MIAAIILNYITWETTISCIESIRKTCDVVKIYVIDNDSPNDSYNILYNKYKDDEDINVFNSGGNLGYAKGNNFGALKAINDKYEILLFTNNDIVFEENAINKMIDTLFENKKISSLAPLIKSINGEIESLPLIATVSTFDYLLSYTRLNKIARIIKKENLVKEKYELKITKDLPLNKIYRFSGCCFMIRSKDFEDVGMFDENTFLYFEEDILCYKLEKRGFQSYHKSDAVIQHHHGKTTGSNNFLVESEMFISEMYYFTKYKNINYFYLTFLYLDRIITPLINILKKKYKISSKEYVGLILKTLKTITKYKLKRNKNIAERSGE